MKFALKLICITVFLLTHALAFAKQNTYYVTQTGSGADYSVAQFNALTGTSYAGDTFYFSGSITSEVTPGISGTSGGGYVTLDGYEPGDCDPINSSCSSSALIDRNDPGSGEYYGINTNDQDYLTIQDFRITDSSEGIKSVYPSTSDHIIIKRNDISVCRNSGIYSGGDSYWTIGGASGDGNKIYNIGLGSTPSSSAGLRFYYVNDLIASYNHIYNASTTYSDSDGIVVLYSTRHLYEYNTVHSQGEDAIDWKAWSSYVIIRFNDFYDTYQSPCQIQRGTDYAWVYGNRFWNANRADADWHGLLIYRGADYVRAWSNLIFENEGSGIAVYAGTGEGDDIISDGIILYNNTVFENVIEGTAKYHAGLYWSISGDVTAKNNIFAANQWTASYYRQLNICNTSNVTLDYNLYYYDGVNNPTTMYGGTDYTKTDPVSSTSYNSATVQDANSRMLSPGFVDYANDNFRLAGDSPCIDAGVDLSGIAGSLKIQDMTYTMYWDTGLDPDPSKTDWSTIPPTVGTLQRDDYQGDGETGWDLGAYVYRDASGIKLTPPKNLAISGFPN